MWKIKSKSFTQYEKPMRKLLFKWLPNENVKRKNNCYRFWIGFDKSFEECFKNQE